MFTKLSSHPDGSPRARRGLVATITAALALAPLATLAPAVANPGGTALVISEVYGGGGNSGATYTHDFIELYNPTDEPVALDGHVVEYFSGGTANSGGTTVLTGSVAPGGHYLIQEAKGAGGTTPLPTPDATGTLSMGGSSGSVLLRTGDTAIDLVGYGSTVRSEGAPAPGLSSTTAATRNAAGADTDNNSVDFTAVGPAPKNSGATPPPTDPPGASAKTIAEIQGNGAFSPVSGQMVITRGVVTAAYPTGGFNGFYIQTGGADTTPGASDGLFVYEPGFAGIEVGDSVEVEGVVKEFSGLTEVDATFVTQIAALPPVVPNPQLPGTGCALPGTDCLDENALESLREEFEGEAFLPSGPVTVTDAFDFGATSSNFFGEIGLAVNSDIPLMTTTEVVDAQDTAGIAARSAYNNAHLVVLDDGSSVNYWNTRNTASGQHDPVPWLTADHAVRVGAAVDFDQPVVLDYRFGWKLQPQHQVVGVPTGLVTFEQDRQAAPQQVGGDLRLATFNVLNYFTTLGGDVSGCSAFVDREDDPVATNRCSGDNGPRGAWEQEDFERQQVKIVKAINTLDADVVSLEELENSLVVDGHDRDEAIAALVSALNAEAGEDRWAFVPSPDVVPDGEDVIRTGFIYDPATIDVVGPGRILDHHAFDDAREPLAQAFRRAGGGVATTFVVVVNHFKSKGCSGASDPADRDSGQGCWNPSRVAQAGALTEFAQEYAQARRTDKVFLSGDFNAYSMEDPVQAIQEAGYTQLESTDSSIDESYSFQGTSGSLDHVFASPAAAELVTGVDVWEINANESVFYQYSRHNYVGTDLYRPDVYASSDHNPEIIGLTAPHARSAGQG